MEYIPHTQIYCDSPKEKSPRLPYSYYNAKGEFLGFEWDNQTTMVLEFTSKGYSIDSDVDVEEYMSGKTMQLELMDFHCETAYKATAEAKEVTTFDVAGLVPGVYTVRLSLIDNDNTIVLMPRNSEDKCLIHIR